MKTFAHMFCTSLACVALASGSARTAPAELAGDLPAIVFAQDGPFLVVDDIYVPQGKTVSIEAGAVFLFKNFTGMQVLGKLVARGEQDKPIIFTSVNDREYNPDSQLDPAPFDWNGVYLHEDAIGSEFRYCAVMYSVEGITAQTKFFRLSPVIFLKNGRASLTIEEKRMEAPDGPYEYAVSRDDPSLKELPMNILSDPRALKRNIIRYTGFTIAMAGAVVSIFYSMELSGSSRKLDNLSSTAPQNLAYHDSHDWERARSRHNATIAGTLIGVTLFAAGGAGFSWSFTF